MKKLDIKNWEKLEVWKILEKLFRIFLFPSFQLVPTAKIKFNNLWKIFPRFSIFQSFQPDPFYYKKFFHKSYLITISWKIIKILSARSKISVILLSLTLWFSENLKASIKFQAQSLHCNEKNWNRSFKNHETKWYKKLLRIPVWQYSSKTVIRKQCATKNVIWMWYFPKS